MKEIKHAVFARKKGGALLTTALHMKPEKKLFDACKAGKKVYSIKVFHLKTNLFPDPDNLSDGNGIGFCYGC